ncbi:MAG: TonB-dependent receptor [Bacteroidia bacterium]|nr:TonB-dependent receptor [Bacteroidia bacterium]
MNKFIKVFLYLHILYSYQLFSQTKGFVFEIKDKDTNYLSDVMIYSTITKQTTYTDSTGFFILYNIPEKDTLDFITIGFTRQKLIIKNPNEKIMVALKPSVALNEVEIVYQKPSSEYSIINPLQIQTFNESYLQKAACCNLSESFETNASIDVQITDALTGIRQIQMNGLTGKYILLTKENIPYLFGIQNARGLTYLPGPFIQSIQLSKGTGAVLNGYESFSGQINTELWNPTQSDFKIYFNTYFNQNARNEYNLVINQKLSNNLYSNMMLHSSFNPLAQDMNNDGYTDIPTGKQFNIVHKYFLKSPKGLDWQWGIQAILDEQKSGQIMKNFSYPISPYVVSSSTQRYDVFSKSGWIFKNRPGHSIGLQLLYSYYNDKNTYGASPYHSLQHVVYSNLIYQGIIGTTAHSYKIGANYNYIQPQENYRYYFFYRREIITGMFTEYTFTPSQNLSLLIGNRIDYHNFYKWIYIPRVHIKLNFNNQNTTFKLSVGKSFRTPTPLAENMGLMASSRTFYFNVENITLPYWLHPEKAWTFGSNLYHTFKMFYRPANFLAEYYYTFFNRQLVTDMDTPGHVFFYTTNRAFAHSIQVECQFQPIKRLETHFSFRYTNQQTKYIYGINEVPYIPKYRGFINVVYNTKNKKWNFDFTAQYISSKRLPYTFSNPPEFQRPDYSIPYWNLLAQITYTHKGNHSETKFYIGAENLNDFKQKNPIISASNPYSPFFDASIIWASIYGRMMYGGIRYYWK